jgi:hypothetical protein
MRILLTTTFKYNALPGLYVHLYIPGISQHIRKDASNIDLNEDATGSPKPAHQRPLLAIASIRVFLR